MPSEKDDVVDSRRIPRWDKVDKMARALLNLQGLSVKEDIFYREDRSEASGSATGTASWATNIGNERGEVVASVLTALKDVASLKSLGMQQLESTHPVPLHRQGLLCRDRTIKGEDSV